MSTASLPIELKLDSHELPFFDGLVGQVSGGKLHLNGSGLCQTCSEGFTYRFYSHRLDVSKKRGSFYLVLRERQRRGNTRVWARRASRRLDENTEFQLTRDQIFCIKTDGEDRQPSRKKRKPLIVRLKRKQARRRDRYDAKAALTGTDG